MSDDVHDYPFDPASEEFQTSWGAYESAAGPDDAIANARMAHTQEHLEAYSGALHAAGWVDREELAAALFRRMVAAKAPVAKAPDGRICFHVAALRDAVAALVKQRRNTIHLARRCPCGLGVMVPALDDEEAPRLTQRTDAALRKFMRLVISAGPNARAADFDAAFARTVRETGIPTKDLGKLLADALAREPKPVPLAIVRRAYRAYADDELMPALIDAETTAARLRCPKCGADGPVTHHVAMAGGAPLFAMALVEIPGGPA